jgi:hypothetical protein
MLKAALLEQNNGSIELELAIKNSTESNDPVLL